MSGFDSACYDCAVAFLPDSATSRLKDELAQHIQDAVEDWLYAEKARLEKELK